MKFSSFALTSSLVSIAASAYVPSEPWTTLTPDSSAPTGAITDYASAFGIAVVPIASSSASANVKRDVISQISDGQIQATTKTTSTLATTTAQAVSQIGDGQIQATTKTTSTLAASTAQAVSQIGDGQIQATTSTSTAQAVSQIGDGQIQATTTTKASSSTASAASQISDGQVQASSSQTTKSGASQISDGQVQQSSSSSSASGSASSSASTATSSAESDSPVTAVSCKTSGTLTLSLSDSVLTDSQGRIGSIVANRQFQFDGPPPQAGAIYAAGWSITEEGNLAIGDNDVFYQCLSGTFYNLYDESIGDQCSPIYLQAVDLVDC
jgi:hypothetical protein